MIKWNSTEQWYLPIEIKGWYSLLGFPYPSSYPSSVHMNDMGPTNTPNAGPFGDLLWRWDTTSWSYVPHFYDADGTFGGGWQLLNDPDSAEPQILRVGEGFWHTSNDQTNFTWHAIKPE